MFIDKELREYIKKEPKKFLVISYLETYTNHTVEPWEGNNQFEVSFYPKLAAKYFDLTLEELKKILIDLVDEGYYEVIEGSGEIKLKSVLTERNYKKIIKKDD